MNGNIYTSTITASGITITPAVPASCYVEYSPFWMTTLPCMAALIIGFIIGNR